MKKKKELTESEIKSWILDNHNLNWHWMIERIPIEEYLIKYRKELPVFIRRVEELRREAAKHKKK